MKETGRSKTPWELRVGLARRGWATEVRVTRVGLGRSGRDRAAAGCWARTWHWAGGVGEVSLHEHATLDVAAPDALGALVDLVSRVDRLCEKAERDFPDAVPCQLPERDADGLLRLAENERETRYMRGQPRDLTPSENIPEGVEAGPDVHLFALLVAARDGLDSEDAINPYFGRARLIRDCENRDWGYKLRLAFRELDGTRISYQPQELTTRLLAPRVVSGLIGGAKASLLDLFRSYGPEGELNGATRNGLPPGFETLAEVIEKRRADEAARDAEADRELEP